MGDKGGPAWMLGTAALITALAGLLGTLHAVGAFDPGPEPQEATGTQPGVGMPDPTEVADGDGRPGLDPTVIGSPSKATVEWDDPTIVHGSFEVDDQRLSYRYFLYDQRRVPSSAGVDALGADLSATVYPTRVEIEDWSGGAPPFGTGGFFVAVEDQPDKQTCEAALAADRIHPVDAQEADVGRWWCFKTRRAHTAAIGLAQLTLHTAPRTAVIDYVVWR